MLAIVGNLYVALVVEAYAPTLLVYFEIIALLCYTMVLKVKTVGISCRAVIDGLRGVASAPTVVARLGDDETTRRASSA